ncbi:MAG TPA: COX15/CtaA family protein [Ktedonobacterales bacterium]|nr:COX15/CtaA family protein [Ktedonobacterales bacterium]
MRTTNGESISGWDTARQYRERMPWMRLLKILAVVTAVGLFLVQMQGVLVTVSGSAAGCGGDWPLCHGQVIPGQFTLHTLTEFGHRVLVPPVTLCVLGLSFGMLAFWRKRRETVVLVILMIVFLLLQAALGALAVVYPTSPVILALHYGVALIAFASAAVAALFIFGQQGWDTLRDRPVSRGYTRLVWALAVYTYVVVYLGAYVQHTGNQLACRGWPLCNGSVFPGFAGVVGINFLHRFGAFLLTAGVIWLVLWSWRLRAARPDLYWGSMAAFTFVVIQAMMGAYVAWSHASVPSMLLHGGFVAGLFAALCYLALQVMARPRSARQVAQTASTSATPLHAAGTAGAASGTNG